MKKNKKIIFSIGFILIFAFCIGIYFRPMTLSDVIDNNSTLLFTKIDLGIKDGKPDMKYVNYNDVTDEQKQEVLQLLSSYSYSRNLKTLFSDGTISDNKIDVFFYIHIYNGLDYKDTIYVGSNDQISFNNRTYTMKNSEKFINQILTIISE